MKAGDFKYIEDSRDSIEVRHRKKCFANGIEVVIEPTASKLCKIHVTHNDRVIVEGKKFFSQSPTTGKNPLMQKVNEMYEYYYNKIIKKEQKLNASHLQEAV